MELIGLHRTPPGWMECREWSNSPKAARTGKWEDDIPTTKRFARRRNRDSPQPSRPPGLADRYSDQFRIGADLVDLVDHISFDLSNGYRRSRALVPGSFLGRAAEIVLMILQCHLPEPAGIKAG